MILISRAFNKILKADRAKYGADEEYEIADTITDEWQQHIDDAVAGRGCSIIVAKFYHAPIE
jgi:hypothetical protein